MSTPIDERLIEYRLEGMSLIDITGEQFPDGERYCISMPIQATSDEMALRAAKAFAVFPQMRNIVLFKRVDINITTTEDVST